MVDPALALMVFAVIAAFVAALFWPRHGVAARLTRVADLTERVIVEDALKHVYMSERVGRAVTLESLAGRLGISTGRAARLLTRLGELDLVRTEAEGPVLTEDGRESAVRLVRTHRLWERYLADRTGVPAGEWHGEAERMEHALSATQVESLSARLGHPRWDPHGDPIPTATGLMPPPRRLSLAGAPADRTVEIVHLEDEPQEIYDALLEHGFALGGRLDVVERSERSVRVRADGREWSVDAVDAQNVTVRVLPEGASAGGRSVTLGDLRPGQGARVTDLSPACQGAQRRRLLDLGVVRGTEITAELASATGDPVAYMIRGALIALRKEQASWVRVEPLWASADPPDGGERPIEVAS